MSFKMVRVMSDEKKFALELIRFYKEFLLGSSKSVVILADMEKKYPEQYQRLKQTKDNPQRLIELTIQMPDEVKETFLLIIVEGSVIGQKMNRLFDLSQDEKEKLAKEIEDFASRVDTKLKALVRDAK